MSWPDEFVRLLVAGGHRVIRYDHRDTGRSTSRDFTTHPYNYDDLTRDAVHVLDGWHLAAAHIVAFSMGAALGQLIAMDHPKRVLSLTLLGASALGVDFFGNIQRAIAGQPSLDGLPTPRAEIFEAWAHLSTPAGDEETELDQRVEMQRIASGDGVPFDPAEFRRWEKQAIDHAGTWHRSAAQTKIKQDLTHRGNDLSGITEPVLAIQGPLDPVNPAPHARHIAESIPGGRVVEIPGMGHAFPSAVHRPLAEAILAHTTAGRSSQRL